MATVKVLDVFNVSNDVVQRGRRSASLSELFGIFTQQKNYVLKDKKGIYNPFDPQGLFYRENWRKANIEESQALDGFPVFSGSINNITMDYSDQGVNLTLEAREQMAVWLEFKVESADKTTHANFTTVGLHNAGDNTIVVTGGSTQIPKPSMCYFGLDVVPRYMITNSTGTPTSLITLDRGLEADLPGGTVVSVLVPKTISIAQELYDQLSLVGLSSRLGGSFLTYKALDELNGRLLRIFVVNEHKRRLSEHLSALLNLGQFIFTQSPNGTIDIRRGLAWDGTKIFDKVTMAEMVSPVKFGFDFSRLKIGYDLPYAFGNGVRLSKKTVDQFYIDTFQGKDTWQPVTSVASNPFDVTYAYNTATTAAFFGDQYLSYYKVPRPFAQGKVKKSIAGRPLDVFNFVLGKPMSFNYQISPNYALDSEPSAVIDYDYDEDNFIYQNVRFEFTNMFAPALPK